MLINSCHICIINSLVQMFPISIITFFSIPVSCFLLSFVHSSTTSVPFAINRPKHQNAAHMWVSQITVNTCLQVLTVNRFTVNTCLQVLTMNRFTVNTCLQALSVNCLQGTVTKCRCMNSSHSILCCRLL